MCLNTDNFIALGKGTKTLAWDLFLLWGGPRLGFSASEAEQTAIIHNSRYSKSSKIREKLVVLCVFKCGQLYCSGNRDRQWIPSWDLLLLRGGPRWGFSVSEAKKTAIMKNSSSSKSAKKGEKAVVLFAFKHWQLYCSEQTGRDYSPETSYSL